MYNASREFVGKLDDALQHELTNVGEEIGRVNKLLHEAIDELGRNFKQMNAMSQDQQKVVAGIWLTPKMKKKTIRLMSRNLWLTPVSYLSIL